MVSLQERGINPPKDNSPYFGIIAEDAGLREGNVMAFDFKKECKELYRPSVKPNIVTVPPMSYVAVRGKGNPNAEGGEYQKSIPLLYGISYTIKMSKKGNRNINGYFDFVVPPLEGFWWQEPAGGEIDYANKEGFRFISCIRLPDFVTPEVFDWAVAEATAKKKIDFSAVEFLEVNEGYAYSACTRVPTITSRQPSTPCMNSPQSRDSSQIFPRAVCITKSTCPTHENALPRN